MSEVLRAGSSGSAVERLQTLLNAKLNPRPDLWVDGDFGLKTEAAVRRFQAQEGLTVDGEVGPRTWAALDAGSILLAPGDAPWMAVARREIGQGEVPGAQSNLRIIQYHATTTLRATSDETAWCSSFVNWCLKQAGIAGTNSAAAASWLKWGEDTAARAGAIAVIYQAAAANSSLSRTGNHVGFLMEETGKHYVMLGGNQSDQVKISSFPKSKWRLKGYRWPKS